MKRALTTFHAAGGRTVVEGSLFDDKEPICREYPALFEDAEAAALRLTEESPVFRAVAPAVEQATAAVAEKAADASRDAIEAAALSSEVFVKQANGAAPKKVIVVPGRLVNLVL